MRSRFSRLGGGLRIGADYFDRAKALGPETTKVPRGLVDRVADLAHDEIDTARIHPAIVTFFEDTAALELLIRSRWRFPFSILWKVFRRVMRGVGQFVYPIKEGRILTRVLGIDALRDGRPDARGVIRTYAETGDVMQAAVYATWERGGKRYMSAAFPVPGGSMTGLLRLDAIAEDVDGRLAIALTSARPRTRGKPDHAGVWFVVGRTGVRTPFEERIELWAAGMPGAPTEIDPSIFPGATIIGCHEQRFLGIRLVTHHYWFRPIAAAAPALTGESTSDRALPPRT